MAEREFQDDADGADEMPSLLRNDENEEDEIDDDYALEFSAIKNTQKTMETTHDPYFDDLMDDLEDEDRLKNPLSHSEGGSSQSVVKGSKHMAQRNVTLAMLIKEDVIQPGNNILCLDLMGEKFSGDLLPDGRIQAARGGQVLNSVAEWIEHCHKSIDAKCGKHAVVCYKGRRLDVYKMLWCRKQRLQPSKSQISDDCIGGEDDPSVQPQHSKLADITQEQISPSELANEDYDSSLRQEHSSKESEDRFQQGIDYKLLPPKKQYVSHLQNDESRLRSELDKAANFQDSADQLPQIHGQPNSSRQLQYPTESSNSPHKQHSSDTLEEPKSLPSEHKMLSSDDELINRHHPSDLFTKNKQTSMLEQGSSELVNPHRWLSDELLEKQKLESELLDKHKPESRKFLDQHMLGSSELLDRLVPSDIAKHTLGQLCARQIRQELLLQDVQLEEQKQLLAQQNLSSGQQKQPLSQQNESALSQQKASGQQKLPLSQHNVKDDVTTDRRMIMLMMTKEPRLSMKHSSLGKKNFGHNKSQLVECASFGQIGKIQPFNLCISTNCLLLMDFHCHLKLSEVMGYMAGKWDPATQQLNITTALPCLVRAADKEKASIIEDNIRKQIEEKGLVVGGWYHSHPLYQSDPSLRDIEAQMEYQYLLKGSPNTVQPCFATIISPFFSRTTGKISDTQIFYVMPPSEQRLLDYGLPVTVQHNLRMDSSLREEMYTEMQHLIKFYREEHDYTPFSSIWEKSVTVRQKFQEVLARNCLNGVIDKRLTEIISML